MKTLNKIVVTLYNLQFGQNQYFIRGTQPLYGKIVDDENPEYCFMCASKSGSQSLWLPTYQLSGIKIFHPHGQSDTIEKVKHTFKTQQELAKLKVAPTPFGLYETTLNFKYPIATMSAWKTHSVHTLRVTSTVQTSLKFLKEQLNVEVSPEFIPRLLLYRDFDALSLSDYNLISIFYGKPATAKIESLVETFSMEIPEPYRSSIDLLSWSNILVGDNGLKVIDFDLC